MDKVEEYMERWHVLQREMKEGGATWCLPDVCPYEDPLFVQAFDQDEVETAEEWIHLKAVPSPQVDQETCLTCLRGEEWCFAVGKVGHKSSDQPPPWQEMELPVLKKRKSGGAKKAAKQVPVPMRVEPELPDPKKGKPKRGRWDGYFRLVEASSWCPSCGESGHSVVNCPCPRKEEEEEGRPTEGQLGGLETNKQ
ncbi:UNVERIFIED_CONTAM: hypothetical protein FKN15_044987 [Acipenser sinensis]